MKTQDIKNIGQAYLSVLEAMQKKLDPVDKDELKGDHKDRKDKDIDNDGDADASDVYLHNRRKTISKASKGKEVETTESVKEQLDHSHAKQVANSIAKSNKNLKVTSSGSGEHFVHHKDDPEGESGHVSVKAAGGQLHVSHEMGQAHGNKKFNDTSSAVAHGVRVSSGGVSEAWSVSEAKKMSISGKQIKAALASAKAQAKPKDQVSLKKAPFDIPKESFDVDSLLAIFENLEESQIDLILANLDEQQLDEISNKTIDSYRKKAYGQYKTSADKASDGPWGSEKPETRAKHAARYDKRHKGIGSADKRTMARDPDNFKFGRIGQDGHDPKKDSMSSKTVGDMRKIKGYSNKKESVVYEAMNNNVLDRLHSGEGASHHMGHEGGARQHHYAAEDARADGNTKAAAHHERASAHHERASEHLEAGNHIMAHHNSERAAHHAKLAVKHGGEETDSHEVHQDHAKAHRLDSAGYTAESTERNWTVLNRILEKARDKDSHTKGATEPEKMGSTASKGEMGFVNAHGGLTGTDSGIDGAKAAAYTASVATANIKVAPGRLGDNKAGDKNIIKPGTQVK